MGISLFALVLVFFGVPSPIVNWTGTQNEAINIRAEGREELLDRCLDGGIEVRYRYEVRYCIRGSYWFDSCEDEWVHIKSIKYDPIKETYLVESDLFDDDEKPSKESFAKKGEAMETLSTLANINIEKIARGAFKKDEDEGYVGIRVLSECRGSVGSTLLDISYYMTFGLVKVSRFDSGWVAFFISK